MHVFIGCPIQRAPFFFLFFCRFYSSYIMVIMIFAAPLPPSGFRVTGQHNDSKDTPTTTLKWNPPRDAIQPRRPTHYELLVSMGRLLMWHDVSSPLHVAIPTYIVSNVTLTAVNCYGTSSSSIISQAGEWISGYISFRCYHSIVAYACTW